MIKRKKRKIEKIQIVPNAVQFNDTIICLYDVTTCSVFIVPFVIYIHLFTREIIIAICYGYDHVFIQIYEVNIFAFDCIITAGTDEIKDTFFFLQKNEIDRIGNKVDFTQMSAINKYYKKLLFYIVITVKYQVSGYEMMMIVVSSCCYIFIPYYLTRANTRKFRFSVCSFPIS